MPASRPPLPRPGQTRLIWIETPGNPLWTITDIAETALLAHAAGALLGVDSTVATPVLSRPLALGADVVMHAATKYLNGHSDVIAGVLVFACNDPYSQRAARVRNTLGSILGRSRRPCCCGVCAPCMCVCATNPRPP
jgi:cystathionine gamma-synthase